MAKKSLMLEIEAATRWITNTITGRPWAFSVEITHNCNANCRHCDKGEYIKNEKQATPAEYKKIYDESKALVVQISGGEPMMRKDYLDVVKAFKNPGHLPYIVFVCNGGLLTLEKYDELKAAGVDQFSISLDFPDERHDENRQVKGLFKHLDTLIPQIMARGNNDVTMITAVHRLNYPYLLDNLKVVQDWGAALNFSMYTAGRTGDKSLLITDPEDLKGLRKSLDDIIEAKKNGAAVFSSVDVLNRYYKFYENGCSTPHCQVGKRSFVVNPDGTITPCAMKFKQTFSSHKAIKKHFVPNNHCDECFISLRANTEKPLSEVLRDVWASRSRI